MYQSFFICFVNGHLGCFHVLAIVTCAAVSTGWWSRKWQPTPIFLPGKPHEQRSLVDCSSQDGKELDLTEHSTEYLRDLEQYKVILCRLWSEKSEVGFPGKRKMLVGSPSKDLGQGPTLCLFCI